MSAAVQSLMDQFRDRARLQRTRLRFFVLDTRDWWERARIRASYQADETLWITRRALFAWAMTLFCAGGLAGGLAVALLAPGGLAAGTGTTSRTEAPSQAFDPAANLSPIMATRPRPAPASAKPRTPPR
jgi:hypothetical protein